MSEYELSKGQPQLQHVHDPNEPVYVEAIVVGSAPIDQTQPYFNQQPQPYYPQQQSQQPQYNNGQQVIYQNTYPQQQQQSSGYYANQQPQVHQDVHQPMYAVQGQQPMYAPQVMYNPQVVGIQQPLPFVKTPIKTDWDASIFSCQDLDCCFCLYCSFFLPCATASVRTNFDGSEWCVNCCCLSIPQLRWLIRSSHGIQAT